MGNVFSDVEVLLEGSRMWSIISMKVFTHPGWEGGSPKAQCLFLFSPPFYQNIGAHNSHKPCIKAGIIIVPSFLSAPGFN